MPIGGNAQVTINVGAKLQVLQSSINDIQKVLDKLEPKSAAFQRLNNIVSNIRNDMEKLQAQTAKGFISQAQFNQTEKTIDKIETSLNRTKIIVDNLKFKDIKLTKEQEDTFKEFENELEKIEERYNATKENIKANLFSDTNLSKTLIQIDKNAVNKDLEDVEKIVQRRANTIKTELAVMGENIRNLEGEVNKGTRAKNLIGDTGFTKDTLGEDIFNKYLYTKGGETLLKPGVLKSQFLAELEKEFDFHEGELSSLGSLTFKQIQQAFKDMGTGARINPFAGLTDNLEDKASQLSELTANQVMTQNFANAIGLLQQKFAELNGDQGEVTIATEEYNQAIAVVAAAITEYQGNVLGAARAMGENAVANDKNKQTVNQLRDALSQANAEFLKQQRQIQTFNSIKSAVVNFMGFNQVLNITRNAVRAAINHIKELDTTMNGIAIVTDMTTADLWKQVDAYSSMAQNFGVTIQGAYEVSKIYYQAGYETNEVLTLTNETLKLAKISGLDYATTTDYMMTAMRGFKLEMEDASRVVDVYSNLAANTAVSQQELAEAMTRTASSMESVGATFEETSAMIATMVAVTRESANNIGSAMKSIASRYGELTKDPTKLLDSEGEAMSFNKVDTALKSVGITLQTTDHQFRDFTDVIMELAEKWDTLDSAQQRYIATQFAGNRQQSRFLALVSNIDLLRENMSNAENSEDIGTLQSLKALDSLESKINQVQVAYQQFYTTIGVEDVWKGFLDGAKNVIDTLNSLPKVFGKIPAAAVILIMNAIQLIKNALLSGVAVIAKTIKSSLNETEIEIEQTAQDAQKQGKNWAENLAIGFEAGAKKLKSTVTNVIDGLRPVQKAPERKYTPEQGMFFNNWDSHVAALNTESEGGKFGRANSQEWKQAFSELLEQLNAVGLGFDTTNMKAEEIRIKLQELSPQIHKLAEEYNNTENKIKEYDAYQKQHQQNVLKTANTFSELGMGLSSLSLLFNDGSAKGKAFSGVMMILGGTLTAVAAGIKAVHGASGWIGLAVTAITTVVSGFATAFESSAEKLERLNKEAEELNNKAKEAKAEYNTLQRSADKYEELKAKRYESAEAAQEYQSAVEELADSFPQLISSISETGEITLNANNIEMELAKAREKTATATYEALQAEQKAKLEELKQKKETSSEQLSKIRDTLNTGIAGIESMGLGAFGLENNQWFANAVQTLRKALEKANLENSEDIYDLYNQIEETRKEALGKIGQGDSFISGDKEIFDSQIVGEYQKANQQYQEALETFTSVTRQEAAAWLRTQTYSNDARFKVFDDNSVLSSLLSNQLYQSYTDRDNESQLWSDWIKEQDAQSDIDLMYNWYTKLDSSKKEVLETMFRDQEKYSGTDIIRALDLKENDSQIIEAIISYYNEGAQWYRNEINKYLEDSGLKINLGSEEEEQLSNQDWRFISEAAKQFSVLKRISKDQANGYQTYIQNLYALTNEEQEIQQLLIDNGLNTRSGIEATIKELKARKEKENTEKYDGIIESLNNLSQYIQDNIYLTATSMTDSILSDWKDNSSDIMNLRTGVSYDKAKEFIDKAKALGLETIEYETSGDKIIFSEQTYQEYLAKYYEDKRIQAERLSVDALAAAEWFKNNTNNILREESRKNLERILGAEGAAAFIENNDYVNQRSWNLKQAGVKYIQQQAQNAADAAKDTVEWVGRIFEEIQRQSNYAIGNYQKDIDILREIATNHQLDANDVVGQEIQKSLNDAYSSLISDVMTYGFKNINLNHYTGLIADDTERKHLEEMIKSGDYTSFIRYYADFAGKTLEETNALIVQALEKQQQSTTGIAQEALGNVDFYTKDLAYASLDTIQKLADALEIGITNLLGEYNKELDQYQVKDISIWAQDIINSTDILFDSINSVINSITKYINSGLEGKLSGADVTNLNAQLARYNIDELVESDFTRTTEGLKLSEQAAFRLYNQLKNIDAIQARITFNDLSKSLQDTNENYKSISDILVRIKDLQKEITDAEAKGDNTRANQYREELSIAKEILAVRSTTDDKSFDFMSGKLPSGFQNPIDYWNSAGKAYKAINEAGKTGYMEIQDYYNIVNEMANLVQLSGTNLEWMGMNAGNATERAAELIQQGFSALSNVDGDGVKISMSELGQKFQIGAEDMGKNFDTGIKEMAQSQIDILDAMIQMLEAVVAMENLGDIDVKGNGLDFSDMFNFAENSDIGTATTEMQEYAKNIVALADNNEELKKSLENIQINNENLISIFNKLADGTEVGRAEAEIYFATLKAMNEMAKNGEYDLESLVQSIQSIASKSGFLGQIKIGNTYMAFEYGKVATSSDGNNWLYNGKNYNSYEQMMQQMAKDALGVEAGDNSFEYKEKQASKKVKLSEELIMTVSINEKGETSYQVGNSEPATSEYKAIENYLAEINSKKSVQEFIKDYDIEITPNITLNIDKSAFENAGKGAIEEAKNAWLAFKNGEGSWDAVVETGAKVGITLDGDTISSINELKQGISDQLDAQYEVKAEESAQQIAIAGETVSNSVINAFTQGATEAGTILQENIKAALVALEEVFGNKQQNNKSINSNYQEMLKAQHEGELKAEKEAREAFQRNVDQNNATVYENIEDNKQPWEKVEEFNKKVEELKKIYENASANMYSSDELDNDEAMNRALALDDAKKRFEEAKTALEQAKNYLEQYNIEKGNSQFIQSIQEGTAKATIQLNGEEAEKELKKFVEDYESNIEQIDNKAIEEFVSLATSRFSQLPEDLQGIFNNIIQGLNWSETDSSELWQESINNFKSYIEENKDDLSITATVDITEDNIAQIQEKIQQASDKDITLKLDDSGAELTVSTDEAQAQTEEEKKRVEELYKLLDEAKKLLLDTKEIDSKLKNTTDTANETNIAVENVSGKQITGDASQLIGQLNDATGAAQAATSAIEKLLNLGTELGINVNINTVGQESRATGNVALAAGRNTLMGELGPELYVTNGHYYIAGQNGAEFVNLPSDAIVFNHLQTERLLKNGSAGRGHAVTNERKATSLATGNAGGPAMASASAALAALKQIRAMWQAMLGASSKDLGSLAGRGGGGGGGKDNDNPFQQKSVTAEIQRWYNLLRQIDKLERDISYQEQLRSKIETDRVANGKAYYESQRKSLKAIDEELIRQKQLVYLQKSWYDNKRAELAASEYGKIFTYDENGLQQYVGTGAPGSGLGLDILENLTRRTVEGQLSTTSASAQQQLAYLRSVGFNTEILKINDDGTRADFNIQSAEDQENMYVQMMENFWSRVDGWRDELDSLYDSFEDQQNKILENEQKRNEILQQIVDNQLEVENKVLDAIVDLRQREINELQKSRDALSDAADRYIDGLNDQLSKERQMYQNQQDSTELNRMRRQLAILQRSGGSASQINSLQRDIQSREQESYFDAQQQQIDAIKEASDAEIERLDAQISLMTETLEYQKENGLLWDQVSQVMSLTEQEINAFILGNTTEWANKSALAKTDDMREIQNMVGQWIGYRDDSGNYIEGMTFATTVAEAISGQDEHDWNTFNDAMTTLFDDIWTKQAASMKEIFQNEIKISSDPNLAAAVTQMSNQFQSMVGAFQAQNQSQYVTAAPAVPTSYSTPSSSSGGSSSGTKQSSNKSSSKKTTSAKNTTTVNNSNKQTGTLICQAVDINSRATLNTKTHSGLTGGSSVSYAAMFPPTPSGYEFAYASPTLVNIPIGGSITIIYYYKKKNSVMTNDAGSSKGSRKNAVSVYASGGLIDYTGPAWVDGTKKKPEGILNAEQLDMLRNSVLTTKNPVMSLINDYQDTVHGTANSSTYNSINRGENIIIEKAEVNMNVARLANDYDAKRAGESALEEMMRIARRNGSNSIKRR